MTPKRDGRGLVLERKLGEAVFINDNIRITVIEVRGKRVRLVFHCDDRSTRISRSEKHATPTDEAKGA